MPRSWLTLPHLAVVIVISACGGSSDEDSAAAAAADYLGGVADADGGAACEQLNAEAQTYVVQLAAARQLGTVDCPQSVAQLSPTLPHSTLELFSSVSGEIDGSDATISGTVATVTVPRTSTQLQLQMDGDEWKVTAAGVEGSLAASVP